MRCDRKLDSCRPGFSPARVGCRMPDFSPAPLACALLTLAGMTTANAFQIERSETRYADRHYEFELVATLDAPIERVEAVLRDYPHYPELDGRIIEAKVLERPTERVAMLQTTLRVCFGPFCRNVKRVERVEELPNELIAVSDAAQSDVKSGETRTQLSQAERGTRVNYRTSIAPDFWIPAFVGRRWMLGTLRDATVDLFKNVEKRANRSDD
jgi:hypothetical protein